MPVGAKMEHAHKLNLDATSELRKLAHDLSNSIETVVQASYLLNQTKLEGKSKKWARMIEAAADEAAQINRHLRELLRAQSGKAQTAVQETQTAKRRVS